MPVAYENIKNMLQRAAQMAETMLERLPVEKPTEANLMEQLDRARVEWQLAHRYFETATDPDLVDYAIYNLQAAERHYAYLLKQARQQS